VRTFFSSLVVAAFFQFPFMSFLSLSMMIDI
jgi:hypothetical protein